MAKKEDKPTEAVLLRDCQLGKHGDVVTLDAATLDEAVAQGMADPHPDAVAAAKDLAAQA